MNNGLFPQQQKILNLVAHDLTHREIADLCNIKKQTVDNHVRSILRRLNARTSIGAVIICIKNGILNPEAIEPKRRR